MMSALYTFKVNQSLICQGNGRSCHKIDKKSDQRKGLMSHNAVKKKAIGELMSLINGNVCKN